MANGIEGKGYLPPGAENWKAPRVNADLINGKAGGSAIPLETGLTANAELQLKIPGQEPVKVSEIPVAEIPEMGVSGDLIPGAELNLSQIQKGNLREQQNTRQTGI